MKSVSICFTYFKSLELANLEAALYSVRQQDLTDIESLIIVDNDTTSTTEEIHSVLDKLQFPVPILMHSIKHGDPAYTHSWSTNKAVSLAITPWILFTRADYLLRFDMIQKFVEVVKSKESDWNGFITSNGCHLANGIADCEQTNWRDVGPSIFQGAVFDYTSIDAGVWMTRHQAFDDVGGLDERLNVWGHAQTHFQWRMHLAGVEFVRIPEVMFFHPHHGAPRDIGLAHQQLRDYGIDIKELWKRNGWSPYA